MNISLFANTFYSSGNETQDQRHIAKSTTTELHLQSFSWYL